MFDPIGPGTPAWQAFDLAVEAHVQVPPGQRDPRKSKRYKSYANHRQQMLKCLKRCGASPHTVAQWTQSLRERTREGDFTIETLRTPPKAGA